MFSGRKKKGTMNLQPSGSAMFSISGRKCNKIQFNFLIVCCLLNSGESEEQIWPFFLSSNSFMFGTQNKAAPIKKRILSVIEHWRECNRIFWFDRELFDYFRWEFPGEQCTLNYIYISASVSWTTDKNTANRKWNEFWHMWTNGDVSKTYRSFHAIESIDSITVESISRLM